MKKKSLAGFNPEDIFFAGFFQIVAIFFSMAALTNYTFFYNYQIILEHLKAFSVQKKLSLSTKIRVFFKLLPMTFLATSYRICLVTSLVYYFKSLSPIPLSIIFVGLIFGLTNKKTEKLKESFLSALMFYSPFNLGQVFFHTL
jgi:hypothetical protein